MAQETQHLLGLFLSLFLHVIQVVAVVVAIVVGCYCYPVVVVVKNKIKN